MSSVYQHGLRLQQERDLYIVRPDEDEVGAELIAVDSDIAEGEAELEGADGISAEDRHEILSELNEIVEGNRLEIADDTFSFVPRRNGVTLPVIINLAALADTVFLAGDYPTALTSYTQALRALSGDDDAVGSLERTVARIAESGANTATPPLVPEAVAALDQSDAQLAAGSIQQALDSYVEALSSFSAGSHVKRGLGGLSRAVDALVSDFDQLAAQSRALTNEAQRLRDASDAGAVANADNLAQVEQERDAALTSATETQTELGAIAGSLAAAEQQVAASAAELETTSAELAAAREELAAAVDREAALSAQVASQLEAAENGGRPASAAELQELQQLRSETEELRTELAAAESAQRVAVAGAEDALAQVRRAEQTASRTEQAQAQLLQRVSGTRTQLSNLADRLEVQRPSDDELLSLLQTRLLIRRVIGSPSVWSENPGIYDAMERYFEELASEQRREGQADVRAQVGAQLDELLGN